MTFYQAVWSQLYEGGWVNIPLLFLASLLFYLLGYRASVLLPNLNLEPMTVFNSKANKKSLLKLANDMILSHQIQLSEKQIEEIKLQIKLKAHKFGALVNVLVALAPLLGLLGTVIGMIETFSSLGDQSLFKASGGIAGGISMALITTEVGLLIAVPGLLISRFLKRIETETLMSVDQLVEIYKQKI